MQTAALVLDRYLEWLKPNGLLGVVVPITLLQNISGKGTRNRLLNNFDVMEVWHLPEGAIPGSSAGTAVILARKLPRPRSRVDARLARVERVERLETEQVGPQRALTYKYTIPYVASQVHWLSNPQLRMESSAFDRIWRRVSNDLPAIDPYFGRIFNGVLPGKHARSTHFSGRPLTEEWRPVLYRNTQGKVLEPFHINWAAQPLRYIRYPSDEFERPRSPEHFERGTKLVMNATRNASSPWRFYAAIDTQRLVVTENFHYVLPMEASAEELAAVLNSMAANAWYSSRNYQRDINLRYLKRLPFPYFDEQQRDEIYSLVHRTEHSLRSPDPQHVAKLQQDIRRLDEIVFDAYGLDDEERKRIANWMNQFQRPGRLSEGVVSAAAQSVPYQGRRWEVTCEVESVSADREAVSLWVLGRDHSDSSVEIPIPDRMPGWALRPGVAFVATVPWNQRYHTNLTEVEWLDFRPLEFGHLSEEDLISLLSKQQ